MGNCRGRYVPPPAVFQGHHDAECFAQIPDQSGLGQAPDSGKLNVDCIHDSLGMGSHEGPNSRNHFIDYHWQLSVLPNHQAFLKAEAWLLNVEVLSGDAVYHPNRLVHQPAGIGIGHEKVTGLKNPEHRLDPPDVIIRISTDLELEPPVPFGPEAGHIIGHFLRSALRYRPVKGIFFCVPPTQ